MGEIVISGLVRLTYRCHLAKVLRTCGFGYTTTKQPLVSYNNTMAMAASWDTGKNESLS